MDAATLRSLALRGGGFSTPRLNDSLQAHGAGLSSFFAPSGSRETAAGSDAAAAAAGTENARESPLAAYCCLKSLNLADNGFESLEGMPRLEELRCLFLERNCLTSLEGLARAAPRLSTLDASANRVTEVGGVEGPQAEGPRVEEASSEGGLLPRTLETLRLSGNDLSGPGALRGLLFRSKSGGERASATGGSGGESESDGSSTSSSSPSSSLLPLLSTLDLSHCSISDAGTLLALLESLPSLRALYLQGNPFWELLGAGASAAIGGGGGLATGGRGRRLAVLAAAPRCTYLNDSPVFGDERAAADAFRESKGCLEAAAAARGRFLEAAALEAERTARLLERPPRFARLAEEEEGDEEPDVDDDDDQNEEDKQEEFQATEKEGAIVVPEKGEEA